MDAGNRGPRGMTPRGPRTSSGADGGDGPYEQSLTLEGLGLTLLGVILSISVTVAFGVADRWWVRLGVGAGTMAALVLLVGFLGRRTLLLKRLADWLIRQGK